MNYNILVLLIVILISIVKILQIFIKRKDEDISNAIIRTGLTLAVAGVPTVTELVITFFATCLSINIPKSENAYVFMIIGFIYVVFGYIVKQRFKDRIVILNMLGIHKKELRNEKVLNQLKITDFNLNEQILDIIPIFDNGTKIDERANSYIVNQIKEYVSRFANNIEEKSGCFTGMAPIPYTIYAGTFLGKANIDRYFEFDRNNGEVYYELKKTSLLKKWPKLVVKGLNDGEKINEEITELVLAISISHQVLDCDLKQFENMKVIRIGLPNPQDNVIKYKEQLLSYKNTINTVLDVNIREVYPNVKTVHLVSSIPSCLSIEIGKSIGMGVNRMMEIVSYHFINSQDIKYPFGVYISGERKGKLLRGK